MHSYLLPRKAIALLSTILLIISLISAHAQDKWTRKADFPGGERLYVVGYSIGTKGYMGGGTTAGGTAYQDFWQFDPSTGIWTQIADYGGGTIQGAATFTIGNKGYVATGTTDFDTRVKDTWEYDPALNKWTRKADFAGGVRTLDVGFSIAGKGYVGTGLSGGGGDAVHFNDFWEYNPTSDVWTRKADFAGTPRAFTVGFSSEGKGYIGTGHDGSNFLRDFWEYNPETDKWTRKSDFSGGDRASAVSFTIDSKGYVGTGDNSNGIYKDLWQYDPTLDKWIRKVDLNGVPQTASAGFSIQGKGYIGTGVSSIEPYTHLKDFWEYTPEPSKLDSGTWTRKADFGGGGKVSGVGFSIGSKGYIGTGHNGTTQKKDFWEYDPSTNAWTQKADFKGVSRTLDAGFSIGSKGYIGLGISANNIALKDFWEYDPTTNTWTRKADFGGPVRASATGISIGSKGYVGLGSIGFNFFKDWWEYDPPTNKWTQRADFGGVGRSSATGFSIGSKGYIGTGYDGNYTDFWEYDPDTDKWARKADFNGTGRWGPVGFSIGNKGYIGTGSNFSEDFKDFWEYDPVKNNWTKQADLPGNVRRGAIGFSIGNKGYIGGGDAYDLLPIFSDFWEYTPGNTQTIALSCPENKVVATDKGICTAVVNGIDPVLTPADNTASVTYTLSGAITGNGSGSVSGKTFNKGVTTVKYELTSDATQTCSFTVTVEDKEAPVVTNVSTSPSLLWPPNHKLQKVTVNYTLSDNCGATAILSVKGNDGATSSDWQVVDAHHVWLRVERSGGGNGRTYTITITAIDGSGNKSIKATDIMVPHDMSVKKKDGNNKDKNELKIMAMPNPSQHYFTLRIESNSSSPMQLRVVDAVGRVIEERQNIAHNTIIAVGHNYRPGLYYAEVLQNGSKAYVKLIKANQ